MRLLVCVLLAVCLAWVSAGTPMTRLQTSLLEKSAAAGSADFAQAVFQASDLLHTERTLSPEEQQRNMEESYIDAATDRIENEAKFRNSPEHKRAVALVEKLHAAGIDASFVETAAQAQAQAQGAPVTEELAAETRSFLQHSSEAEMDAAAQQEHLADLMAESKAAAESSDHSEMEHEVEEADEFLKHGAKHFDDLIEKGVLVQAEKVTNEVRYADFPGNWDIAHQVDSLDNAVGADDAVFLQAPISTDDSVLLETFEAAGEKEPSFEDAIFNANELLHFESQEKGQMNYLDAPVDRAADRVMVEVQHQSDPAYWHAAQLVKKLTEAGVADNEEPSVFLNTGLSTMDAALVEVHAEAEAEAETEAEAEAETEVDAEGEAEAEGEVEGEAEADAAAVAKASASFDDAVQAAGNLLPEHERPQVMEDTSVDRAADRVTQDFLDQQGVRGWSVAEYSTRLGQGEPARDPTVFLGMEAQLSADPTADAAALSAQAGAKKPMRKLPNVAFLNPSFAPYGHAFALNGNGQITRDYAGYALPAATANTKASQVLSEPQLSN